MTADRDSRSQRLRAYGWSIAVYLLLSLVPYVFPIRGGFFFGQIYPLGFLVFGPVFAWLLVSGLITVVRHALKERRLVRNAHLDAVGIAVFGGAAVLAVRELVFLGLPAGSDTSPFDAQAWAASEQERTEPSRPTPRQRMLKAVVQRLPGISRDELQSSLGPSLDTPYFRETGRDFIYYLGPGRRFLSLDSEWLLIWLTPDAKVSRFAVVED